MFDRFRSLWFSDEDEAKVTSPSTQMALALADTNKPIYAGTVPHATVVRRRKKNKAARQARALHRRAARR